MPMKAGGGVEQNARLKQGAPVSSATQGVETTTWHCQNEKLSGDTYQPPHSPMPTKKEERGKGKRPHKSKILSSKLWRTIGAKIQLLNSML